MHTSQRRLPCMTVIRWSEREVCGVAGLVDLFRAEGHGETLHECQQKAGTLTAFSGCRAANHEGGRTCVSSRVPVAVARDRTSCGTEAGSLAQLSGARVFRRCSKHDQNATNAGS